MKENGHSTMEMLTAIKPGKLDGVLRDSVNHESLSIDKALFKWYNFLRDENYKIQTGKDLFSGQAEASLFKCFAADINRMPALLMEEFVSSEFTPDRRQYIRLIQALLVNLSNEVYAKMIEIEPSAELRSKHEKCCIAIKIFLDFLRNFFYQYFDMDHRVPVYWQAGLSEKIEKQLTHIPKHILFTVCFKESISLSFYQVDYINFLLPYVQNTLVSFTNDQLREFLFENNFNAERYVDTETTALKSQYQVYSDIEERIQFLEKERDRITHLNMKTGIAFDKNVPSIRKQLCDWINRVIKQMEGENKKTSLKESGIDPECKIQTTLSVAKLAVLIRLMVVDKIIINQPVAPVLRTVAKVFSTLQKDEISVGSLETKYHAPDKTTINAVKDMLFKWINILGKL